MAYAKGWSLVRESMTQKIFINEDGSRIELDGLDDSRCALKVTLVLRGGKKIESRQLNFITRQHAEKNAWRIMYAHSDTNYFKPIRI